jgi:hypothetical protein
VCIGPLSVGCLYGGFDLVTNASSPELHQNRTSAMLTVECALLPAASC